ncbi:MAG TPA: SDR family oxidoreductase [Burkholderiaceae bacterium]|jgi:NAD(P)-dependent dehydrogenase (short-subunit alcohol dehydrogenase family)|nr:SDR family oxidoreductase [Burkholderiaceae bacterium]
MPQAPQPRVALVTGAAKRIGREIALALARDGWDVAVHYATSRAEARATAAEIEALGRRAITVNRNLAVTRGVRSVIDECTAELGPVTCLVNNASIFEYDTPQRFKPELLVKHVQVNTAAPLLLTQALAERLAPRARAVVVNLLDQKLWNPNPDFLSYTLSKCALEYATRVLAQAFAPRLRVVGVAPGVTLQSHLQTAAGFARAQTMTPLKRSSTPADVAAAVVYLANAPAVTGTTLIVDGGQHLMAAARDVMYYTERK